ncbi:MAG: response regulator [Candidatus Omnitrophica bacterium]|nr:response regulator [Candidatus Omnitrophota bacterium]
MQSFKPGDPQEDKDKKGRKPAIKLKVLVVDDEEIIRDFLTRLFTLEGVEVKATESGFKAKELAKEEHFDIFFLDVRMPGIDGVDTFKELKRISPKSKYVMMTGYSLDELLKRLEGEDIEAVITKPFEIKEIVVILEDYMRQKYPEEIINVLVVETEDIVLNFFKKLLQNYHVTSAKTGAEALAMLQNDEYDLIISDMALNDMSGVELYSKIQELKPNSKIILVTGDAKKTEGLVRESLQQQIKTIIR